MVTRIRSITPLQLGVVYGVLYALLGFIFGVVFAVASLAGASGPMPGIGGFGWLDRRRRADLQYAGIDLGHHSLSSTRVPRDR